MCISIPVFRYGPRISSVNFTHVSKLPFLYSLVFNRNSRSKSYALFRFRSILLLTLSRHAHSSFARVKTQHMVWVCIIGQDKVRRRGPNWKRRSRERPGRQLDRAVTRQTTRRCWWEPALHVKAPVRGTVDEHEDEEVDARKEYREVTSRRRTYDHETRSMHLDPATHSSWNDAENADSRVATICILQMWQRVTVMLARPWDPRPTPSTEVTRTRPRTSQRSQGQGQSLESRSMTKRKPKLKIITKFLCTVIK